MERTYTRINWENEPSILTPLNATNLNKIDSAVYTIDGRVVTQDTTKANQSDLLQCVKQVDYNTTTGVMTFTWQNGTQYTIDLNIEKIPVTFSMDEHGVITMTTADGTQYTADVGSLIKTYTFNDSSVIDFTVTTDASGNKTVTADIIDGSITGSKLEPNYLNNCQQAQAGAESAEASADADRLKSEGYAVGTQDGVPVQSGSEYYHNNAKYYSEQANVTSLVSLTDVDINNPQNNESLVYNSTTGKWENKQGGTVIEELNDIGDVNITNPTNRQALVYDATNSEWVNGSGGLLPRMVITTESGSTVSITNGSETITPEAQGMGIYYAELPDFDDWTVTATKDGQTSTQIVTVDAVKIYTVNASFFTAYINVTAPSGSTVTVANGAETYTQTSGYNFTVHSSGTWTVTCTKTDASKSASVSITSDGQTATATFEFATITVDYATEFSGATITATDGTHTYTRVASGTVSFDIADLGTWTVSATVSGQTYSASVVVSSYTTYTASLETDVTLTLTVYSGASDTVFYYPDNDTTQDPITLCTTDSSGQGSGTITIPSAGTSITFYSTVAKDTTDGSTNYSKNVSLTNETSVLLCMPDKTLYWYGYENATFEAVGYTYSDYQREYAPQITKATNEIVLTSPSDGTAYTRIGAMTAVIDMTNYASANVIVSNTPIAKPNGSDWRNRVSLADGLRSATSNLVDFVAGISEKRKYSIPTSNTGILCILCNAMDNSGTSIVTNPHIHALWLE